MAVVWSLRIGNGVECGVRAGERRWLAIALASVIHAATLVRAEEWVSPPSLDTVPVRTAAVADDGASVARPAPIVVPLPSGLEAGAICLAGMAAQRWWKRRRQ